MTREEAMLAGLVNGTNTVLSAIVRKLDDELDRVASEAEQSMPPSPEMPRLDLFVMRQLAKALRGQSTTPWTPIVIDGGKQD